MVIKTETCNFSEFRVYPGRGCRFVAKDGRTSLFINRKSRRFHLRKVKAQRITWTTAWRRANKKIKTDDHLRKKKKRNVRINKAIVGISLDDIKKKKNEKPETRAALTEQALREIKERKQKEAEKRRAQ